MDAFFAAIEEKRHPELKGKPLVIGGSGDPHRRGVVSTANYEARKFGIRSGMPLITAYKLCPEAVFLPVDYQEYSRVSSVFKSVLRNFSPIIEDMGIDEVFIDITQTPGTSEDIAKEIKRLIYEKTGLTCSVGIGPNKLIAKIASDAQKPDGLTIVEEKDVLGFLAPLPVRKLYGVGPKTEAHLNALGIKTVSELRKKTLPWLIENFGNSYGSFLYMASRGIDESPLITEWEPKSISREMTFQKDIGKWQTLAKSLAGLIKEVVEEMKEEGYKGRTITIKIRFKDFSTFTRAKTLAEPTDKIEIIRKAAFEALGRLIKPSKHNSDSISLVEKLKMQGPPLVRLVGVRVSAIERQK